jgi:endonuclease III
VLFTRYPTPPPTPPRDRTELEALITPTGFFRAKTDSLIKLGRRAHRAVSTARCRTGSPTS